MAAPVSSAHPIASEEPAVFKGAGEALWGTKSTSLETVCSKFFLEGKGTEKELTTLTVHPMYEECLDPLRGPTPWDTNGCNYVLSGETTARVNTAGNEEIDAPISIECPAGKSISATVPGCMITVPAQENLHGTSFENKGRGTQRDFKLRFTIDKIKYTTPGGFSCAIQGLPKEGADMFQTGSATVKGYKGEGQQQIGIWVGSEPQPPVHELHSEAEKTVFEGYGIETNLLGTKAGSLEISCLISGILGTVGEATAAEITAHPVNGGCSAEPFGKVTWNTEDCDFTFYTDTTSHPKTSGGEETDAPLEINCTVGQAIEISFTGCTILIPDQKKVHGVTYENEEQSGFAFVNLTTTADNLRYTSSGANCAMAGLKAEGSDMFLTDTQRIEAHKDLEAVAPSPDQESFNGGGIVNIWVE